MSCERTREEDDSVFDILCYLVSTAVVANVLPNICNATSSTVQIISTVLLLYVTIHIHSYAMFKKQYYTPKANSA